VLNYILRQAQDLQPAVFRAIYVLTDSFEDFLKKIIEEFFDVLQVFMLILFVYTCRLFRKPAVSGTFYLLRDIPFPPALIAL